MIGVDIKGIRHLLNIYADKVNNSHFWLDAFEGLKSRGVKNILFLRVLSNFLLEELRFMEIILNIIKTKNDILKKNV